MRQEYLIQDESEYRAKIIVEYDIPFLHLDFKKWSPTAFKKLLRAWALFRETIDCPLFALSNDNDDDKWHKFVERLGFTYFTNVDCPDGINRRCFVSLRNKPHG